ncbi:MAG: flagellar basal body-associated FliL family protein, partial [Elusimicrobiota bacterium]
ITIGIVAIVNLVFLSLFYFFIMVPSQKRMGDEEEIRKKALEIEAKKARERETRMGLVSDTITVIVNPPPPDHESFIKAGFTLEYEEGSGIKVPRGGHGEGLMMEGIGSEIAKRLPKIRSILISELSSTPLLEMRSQDGKERLCTRLLNRINKIFPEKNSIKQIYIVDFIIQ